MATRTARRRAVLSVMAAASVLAPLVGCGEGVDEGAGDESTYAAPLRVGGKQVSRLWGLEGEAWSPRSRLPDFSHAGYRGGDRAIPRLPVMASVRDFGAKGNGEHDDTDAFQRAFDAVRGGALLVPRGRYVIRRRIHLRHGHLVLRGEGSGRDGSVIYFPRSLRQAHGAPPDGHDPTYWSHSGGFISVEPRDARGRAFDIVEPAERGDRRLTVDGAERLRAGMVVMIELRDDARGSLRRHIYNDLADPPPPSDDCTSDEVRLLVEVARVEGSNVVLRQPLRLDVRRAWRPRLVTLSPLREVGFERLRFEFPDGVPYAGHHREPGYNAIELSWVVHGWLRNVTFQDADNGLVVGGSKWLTIENVRFVGRRGHHGINFNRSADNLVSDVRFGADFVHELTVGHYAHGNVFRRVGGADDVVVNLDHHGEMPFENLFTSFRRVRTSFASGGLSACNTTRSMRPERAASGARSTFWNLHPGMKLPPWVGMQANVIGPLADGVEERRSAERAWVERLAEVYPPDLWQAQRRARHAREGRRE